MTFFQKFFAFFFVAIFLGGCCPESGTGNVTPSVETEDSVPSVESETETETETEDTGEISSGVEFTLWSAEGFDLAPSSQIWELRADEEGLYHDLPLEITREETPVFVPSYEGGSRFVAVLYGEITDIVGDVGTSAFPCGERMIPETAIGHESSWRCYTIN